MYTVAVTPTELGESILAKVCKASGQSETAVSLIFRGAQLSPSLPASKILEAGGKLGMITSDTGVFSVGRVLCLFPVLSCHISLELSLDPPLSPSPSPFRASVRPQQQIRACHYQLQPEGDVCQVQRLLLLRGVSCLVLCCVCVWPATSKNTCVWRSEKQCHGNQPLWLRRVRVHTTAHWNRQVMAEQRHDTTHSSVQRHD